MRGKYRGKRIDTGEWVYGYLIGKDVIVGEIVEFDDQYFCTEFWWRVDPETVGPYIGLNDRNGTEIYKGDIYRMSWPDCMAVVEWDADGARFIGYTIEHERKIVYVSRCDKNNKSAIEVIGNKWDNKDLLGGESHG